MLKIVRLKNRRKDTKKETEYVISEWVEEKGGTKSWREDRKRKQGKVSKEKYNR